MKLKSSILFLGVGLFFASCTNKTIPTNGESDDMYASSADAASAPLLVAQNTPYSTNTQVLPYDDEYDRVQNDQNAESTDDYYSEDYLTTRDLKRPLSSNPGYSDGYAQGYSQAWTDYSWSRPNFNSPFSNFYSPMNMFAYSSPFFYNSFSPFRSGFSFAYSPFGFRNTAFGYGGFGNMYGGFDSFGSMYSPWGMNSFYNPWGFNSFYSPYDYYGFYGNGFNGSGNFYNNYGNFNSKM